MTHTTENEQNAPVDWRQIAARNEKHWKTEATRRVDAEAQRDGAYRERAQLLAWLATIVPAFISPAPDVDEPDWQLLFLYPGGAQLSWHIAPADADLFEHVERVDRDDPLARWDGHTTEEKYQRIRALTFSQLRGQTQHAREDGHTGATGATETMDVPEPTDDANGPHAGAEDREVLADDWDRVLRAKLRGALAGAGELRDQRARLEAELVQARSVIDRVRQLHFVGAVGNEAAYCGTCTAPWPCPTASAIDQPDDRP